jgi:hypothetical protein
MITSIHDTDQKRKRWYEKHGNRNLHFVWKCALLRRRAQEQEVQHISGSDYCQVYSHLVCVRLYHTASDGGWQTQHLHRVRELDEETLSP